MLELTKSADSAADFLKEIGNYGQFEYKFAPGFVRSGKKFGELTLVNRKKIKILTEEVIKLGSSIAERKNHTLRPGCESAMMGHFQRPLCDGPSIHFLFDMR